MLCAISNNIRTYAIMLMHVCITDASYWDEEEISSDHYQRPYQYFLRLSNTSASKDLDKYSFTKSKVWSLTSEETILETILKYSLFIQFKYDVNHVISYVDMRHAK